VSYVVLDEADRMLDVGFEPDIRAIVGMTQSREQGRHTSMFSATWPPAVRGLAESFMNDPVRVTVGSDELSANHRVEQSVEVLEDGRAKERRLEAFLRKIGAGPRGKRPNDKVLVFALYKKEAQRVEDTLRRNGYSVAGIHGDLNQHQRMASLDAFKKGETPILVATGKRHRLGRAARPMTLTRSWLQTSRRVASTFRRSSMWSTTPSR
jgi:ATP-dependent RNA helicase DBP3